MKKETTHTSKQIQLSNQKKKDYEKELDEIYDPEEDYFDVRKSEQIYNKRYSYKRFNKENPY